MEDNFARARLEGLRQNKYLIKKYRNKARKEFLEIYIRSKGEITPDLQKATSVSSRLSLGCLDIDVKESEYKRVTKDEIENLYKKITENADNNFVKFYESYLRKLELRLY